jgi:hypothetical protein
MLPTNLILKKYDRSVKIFFTIEKDFPEKEFYTL